VGKRGCVSDFLFVSDRRAEAREAVDNGYIRQRSSLYHATIEYARASAHKTVLIHSPVTVYYKRTSEEASGKSVIQSHTFSLNQAC
jgi:hypothetical protein